MMDALVRNIAAAATQAGESAPVAWGENEGMVVIVLLGVAGVLTLALGGFFAYIMFRAEKDDDTNQP